MIDRNEEGELGFWMDNEWYGPYDSLEEAEREMGKRIDFITQGDNDYE